MSVNVTIQGVRRQGVGTERAVLLVDLLVGSSHQQIPFHEQQLLALGSAQKQIDFIVQQAVALVNAQVAITDLSLSVPDLRSTTLATGSVPMAGIAVAQRLVTADTVVTLADYAVWCDTTSAAIAVTLPTAIGNAGQRFEFKNLSAAHATTLTPAGSEKIDGASTLVLALAGQFAVLTSDGANWKHTPGIAASVGASAAGIASVADAPAKAALTALQAALVAQLIVTAPS